MRPSRRPAAAARSSASTTCRRCSSGRANAPIAEGVQAQFEDGDAEALPFEDDSFDVVTSVFGAMFAPDQERTAAELARVTRPGGKIGLVDPHARGLHRQPVQGDRQARAAARGPPLADPVGHRGTPSRAVRRRDRRASRREAALDVPLPLATDVGRLLATLLRPDAQGVRGRRRGRARCPRSRPARDHRALQPRRRRHDGRAERVPRGRDRHALTRTRQPIGAVSPRLAAP